MVIVPTIYVVEDDDSIRRSLERLLDEANLTASFFSTAEAFLAALPRVGCVVLDIRLPGMDGLAVQARLLELGIDLPVIVVAPRGDVSTAVRAMKAGAIDILEQPYDDAALLVVIRNALSKKAIATHAVAVGRAARRVGDLSLREREVLDGLVLGRSNKIIAEELGLSIRTIESHRARMMARLGVRQLAEAIELAIMAAMAGK
jgi:two-component system response regulator FixJ